MRPTTHRCCRNCSSCGALDRQRLDYLLGLHVDDVDAIAIADGYPNVAAVGRGGALVGAASKRNRAEDAAGQRIHDLQVVLGFDGDEERARVRTRADAMYTLAHPECLNALHRRQVDYADIVAEAVGYVQPH